MLKLSDLMNEHDDNWDRSKVAGWYDQNGVNKINAMFISGKNLLFGP